MRHLIFIALASLLASLVVGCGEGSSERRTWQPSDHAQPAGREVDPSRQAAGASAAAAPGPSEATTARAASVLFRMMCASCHGLDGKGSGSELPMGATPPDFTDAAWQSERTDAQLVDVIRQGRGMMPAFSEQVADEGLQALIGHIRRFAASDAPPTAEPAPTPAAPAPTPSAP